MTQSSSYALGLSRNWVAEPHLTTGPPTSGLDAFSPRLFTDRLHNAVEMASDVLAINYWSLLLLLGIL
jgi:hypothetical protein